VKHRNTRPTRRLACAALCLLTVALWAWPAAAQDSSSPAHQEFVFAYRLLQRGEDDSAREAFDEYLGKFPNDEKRGDALYYRALLERKANRNAKAAELLKDAPAPKLVPDYAVLILKAQVAYDLGQHDQAAKWLEQINQGSLEPTIQASVLYLRGLTYRGMNNLPAALAQLQQVAAIDSPLKARAMVDLAKIQALTNKTDEAIATLQGAIALNDAATSAEAARVGGDLAYQANQFDKAIELYRVVTTHHTSSPHFGFAVTGILWSQFKAGKFGDVLTTFEQFRETLPQEQRVPAWYLAGSAHQQLNQHEQAINVLRSVLTAAAGSELEDKVLYKLAVSQSALGQYDAMGETVARLNKQYPESTLKYDVEFLLAAADAKRGDPARGAARLTTIIDAGQQHPYYQQAILQRARLYETNNQLAPAADDYARVIGLAYVKPQGIAAPTIYDAALRLIDLRQRLDQAEQAQQVATELLARPDLAPLTQQQAMYRLALIQIKLNKPDAALKTLDDLLAKHPQNIHLAESRYYRGLLLMSLSRPDDAVTDLRTAADMPSLPDALKINAMRLAATRLRDAQQEAPAGELLLALEKLVGLARLTPDELVWLGRYQLHNVKAPEGPRAALKYLKPILEGSTNAPGPQRAEALLLVAQALRQLDDKDAAVQALKQVVAMGEGNDMQARLELARTLRLAGKNEEALAEYAGLIIAPQTPVASEALFQSAMIQREIVVQKQRASDAAGAERAREEARKMLKRLVLLYSFPELSPLPELAHIHLAELLAASGKQAAAIAEMQELSQKYPDSVYAAYAKAMLLALENKRAEAKTLFNELRNRKPPVDARLAERLEQQVKALEGAP
jgi:tetratricopeptide (TPR) repeat protein